MAVWQHYHRDIYSSSSSSSSSSSIQDAGSRHQRFEAATHRYMHGEAFRIAEHHREGRRVHA